MKSIELKKLDQAGLLAVSGGNGSWGGSWSGHGSWGGGSKGGNSGSFNGTGNGTNNGNASSGGLVNIGSGNRS